MNSPTKRDKSTQTPEKNREEVTSTSNIIRSAKNIRNSTHESSNTTIAKSVNDHNESVVSVVSHRCIAPRVGGSIGSRYYNQEEDKAILNFIVHNRRYSEVNGKALWIMMEEKNVVADRSWQSMKERYQKYIAPNIEMFDNLNSNDIKQLNKYLSTVSKHIKNRTT